MKKKGWLYGGIGLVVAILAGIAIYQGGITEVDAVEVTRGTLTRTVEDTAVVQAADESRLYAQVNGTVAAVEVEVGQEIKAGQILMRLDNPDLSIQLKQTEMQLSQTRAGSESAAAALGRTRLQLSDARKNLERVDSLRQSGAISESEYEQALSAVKLLESSEAELLASLQASQEQLQSLENTLAEVQAKNKQLIVTANISGQILSLDVKAGEVVMPGQLLASIGSSQNLELKAHILSDDLAEIAVGQKVNITAPVLGTQVLKGQVTRIYPKAEEIPSALGVIQRRVPVIISLNDPPGTLQPGFEVRIAIETKQEEALMVPRQSVRTTPSGAKEVFLIKDNKVNIQPVEVGLSNSTHYAIISGLNEGDIVVRDASQDLTANSRVKPVMP